MAKVAPILPFRRLLALGWPSLAGLAALLLVGFWPGLSGQFVNWDDTYNFLTNYNFRGFGWEPLHWAWSARRLGVYQPLAWMLLEAEYALGGLEPEIYHVTSLGLHVLNTGLLWVIMAQMALVNPLSATVKSSRPKGEEPAPLTWFAQQRRLIWVSLLAVWFGCHPLRVEAVAWVSCQPYLVAALFILLATWCYMQARLGAPTASKRWLYYSFGLFVAACLAKAAAAFWPVVFVAIDFLLKARLQAAGTWASRWRDKQAFVLVTIATLAVATWARGEIHQSPQAAISAIGGRLQQATYALSLYLQNTLWPTNLSHYYPPLGAVNPSDTSTLLRLVVPTTILGVVLFGVKLWPRATALGVVWLAALAPNLGFLPIATSVAADRYTYLATLAFCLGLGLVLSPIAAAAPAAGSLPLATRSWLRRTPALVLLLLLPLVWLTRQQCRVWHDSLTLWQQALAAPGGEAAEDVHNNLGLAYSEAGDFVAATRELRTAIQIKPLYALGYTNLGIVQVHRGQFNMARASFASALELDPRAPEALTGMAAMNLAAGELDAGRRNAQAALHERPDDPIALGLLAQIEATAGQLDAAMAAIQAALALAPTDAVGVNTLGAIYSLKGDKAAAAAAYAKAIALNPRFVEAEINLGDALQSLGQRDGAAAHYRAALVLQPQNAKALAGLQALSTP